MKCPACNAINPDHAIFCKSCGKALRSNLRTCPNGHDYDASLPACPHCPPARDNLGLQPTARMGDDVDKTRLDTSKARLQPGHAAPSAPADDKTVILGAEPSEPEAESGSEAKPRPQANRMLTGWLVTFDIDPMGRDYKLYQGRHIIGSAQNCDIRLSIPGVSAEHAVLLCRNGKYIIEDNLSSNGTFVNGEMIEDKVYLNENDIIRIATVDLKLKTV
ncbi:MAG: FHA domain-containing protein [Candidatus Cloacimonadaceae bacterium]|jgi:hypothetical protein|nr:FHA domain-containing protein [Candidatus Cloacimonadota bacterium]MDX9949465.1 FHA domain-containing protein [Candidatus Syntrophosphaera sp.]NLN84790.1 FHA domain-containing protein [Candidatus Cloacimonadota bacterium]